MPRLQLIINPIAGTSSKKGLEGRIVSLLLKQGWNVESEFTRSRGNATQIARRAVDAGFDAVVAVGGDGTVNETASALCDTGVAFGIIPCGSGNGLARHLRIPIDVEESAAVVTPENIVAIDYGTINSKRFFCTAGVGFDAAVAERFAAKHSRGLSTYLRSVVEEFHLFQPCRYALTVGGKTVTESAFVIAVCNASQYGNNAFIAPGAAIDDGLFDVTVIHAGNTLRTLLVGFDMMAGNINHNTLITHFQTPALTIRCLDRKSLHVDGDPHNIDGDLSFECRHRGLRVFVPGRSCRVVPFVTPAGNLVEGSRLTLKHLLSNNR